MLCGFYDAKMQKKTEKISLGFDLWVKKVFRFVSYKKILIFAISTKTNCYLHGHL